MVPIHVLLCGSGELASGPGRGTSVHMHLPTMFTGFRADFRGRPGSGRSSRIWEIAGPVKGV
jgi:hypothetical protein